MFSESVSILIFNMLNGSTNLKHTGVKPCPTQKTSLSPTSIGYLKKKQKSQQSQKNNYNALKSGILFFRTKNPNNKNRKFIDPLVSN